MSFSLAAADSIQLIETTDTLMEPLVGENPTYMNNSTGCHVMQANSNYHKFDNPLYFSHEYDTNFESALSSAGATYAYPRMVSAVYLLGDATSLSESLPGSLARDGHTEVQGGQSTQHYASPVSSEGGTQATSDSSLRDGPRGGPESTYSYVEHRSAFSSKLAQGTSQS